MKLSWDDLMLPPLNLWNVPTMFRRVKESILTLTTNDINERLKNVYEVDLLEILEISSEDLVDRFQDRIQEKRDSLEEDLED